MGKPSKIDKSNVEEILSLSPLQEGMLFHYLKDQDSEEYFEQLSLSILGEIDMLIFQETWDYVTSKNQMLRTLFRWDKLNMPVQIVLKEHKTKIITYDFCGDDILKSRKQLCDIKNEDKNNKFDLEEVPFRVTLCKLRQDKYEMIISNHHILYDGWSNGVILNDFFRVYNSLANNESIEKAETFKISKFIKYLKEKDKNLEEEFWKKYLMEYEGDNFIEIKQDETLIKKLEQQSYEFSNDFIKEIELFIKDKRMTFAELIYCSWGILLQKYSNQKDIVFGTTISGRNINIQGIEKAVGLFINTIPMRVNSNDNKSISLLLQEVKKSVRERELYETTALTDIKKYSGISGKKDLFNSLVVVENYPLDNLQNMKNKLLNVLEYSMEEQTNYPLTLSVSGLENKKLTLIYNETLVSKEYAKTMLEHFINILKFFIKETDKNVSEVDFLSQEEKSKLLYEFNNTHIDYAREKTIYEFFEEQAYKAPDNDAVVLEDKKLTYRELNERANSLARVLRDKGVKADSIVGIMVERSLEMIVGIMAILKAGGAYLPIDPSYPKERIEYMLKDSESAILLSDNTLAYAIEFSGEIIDLFNEGLFSGESTNLEKINSASNLAYVIYTSGTTGNPKGVMIKHSNLNNFITCFNSQFKEKICQDDKVLSLTNYAFDVSVCEFFVALTSGAVLVINDKHKTFDPEEIAKLIVNNEITFTYIPPSLLPSVYEKLEVYKDSIKLKKLLVGVEAIRGKILNKFYNLNKNLEIINGYGPTEATICSTFYKVKGIEDEDKAISIGNTIGNTNIYILNGQLKLVPIGAIGEIFVSGSAVGKGYLNRPELTAEKFIENPFEPGMKMYKTGDLARWLPDGNIEFVGRIDNQVKIRGFRIELGEIENRLLQHESIEESVVLVKENEEKEKYICAYIVSKNPVEELNLKNYLKQTLPEYMVPAYFVQLEKMPLTTSGKVDRRALPEPNLEIALTRYEAPNNKLEETLAKIWSEVLGVENIGVNDNFFDVGGHSLKATVLMSKIHKELNKNVSLKDLFKLPTIKELSEYIADREENLYSQIEKVEEKEYYEASSAQKRMYMLQQFDKASIAYNMSAIYNLEGEINKERIEETFNKLVTRHEALRTYFNTINGDIVQRIDNSYEFKLAVKNKNGNIKDIINNFVNPFDLENAPLFRVELLENQGENYLLIDMHHIISDGISMSILIKEFTELYNGKNLNPLKLQYKDFAAWQNSFLKSKEMKIQEDYWISRFSDAIPVLNLPTDYERPTMQSYEGDSVSFEVNEKITSELRNIAKAAGVTMHMVLLSAFNILLSKYSGEEDIVIGTPIAGRPHADLENIMGMFVNTLALRNKPEGNKKCLEFLKEVKENSLKAYENQSYQLEALVEKLDIRRDTSRNPLFDVMFNIIDTTAGGDIILDNTTLKQYENESKLSKFDLTLNALESDTKLNFEMEYCSKIFKKETIERLSSHYVRILKSITENREIKISEIHLLSEEERNQVLYDFNDRKVDYPKDKTISELFEAQVEKSPDNVAVVLEHKKLTYRELNEKANSVARVLREKGVKADSIVGIMVERSLEMIVGIMAILKAGGAYLPIDPYYPKERIEYMLKDSESAILLSHNTLADAIEFSGEIIDLFNEELFSGESTNLERMNSVGNLAYVIYTSGTTGNPKGVMIKQCNLNNFIACFNSQFKDGFCQDDKVLSLTNYAFDVSVCEFFVALTSGAVLVVNDKHKTFDPEEIAKLIVDNEITFTYIPPSLLPSVYEKLEVYKARVKLKKLLVGVEAIRGKILNRFYNLNKNLEIVNGYGPTEATICSTFYKINGIEDEDKAISIGKTIGNTNIYILNGQLKLVPIGAIGEIFVSGAAVGKGYLNRSELTAEKFIENPFEPGTKMYKTGDLARWLPNGNIEFVGRIDNQVKIRGFRIELGEIENRLLQHESVKESVVLVKENEEKDKYICAYVVSKSTLEELDLKNYLKQTLPEYMVPAYFVQLEKMPLTTSGKVDRRSLPEPNLDIALTEYEAPNNKLEETLAKIWSEVLGVEKIGVNDNFFELGGHSLKATVLISKIHKELNKEVSLKELFKAPTIKELSRLIKSAEENTYSNIEKVEEKEYYETSSAQKRMYMLQQFDKNSTAYNMPAVFELKGKVHKNKIEEIFSKLVERHEAIRSYFETLNGEIVQRIENDYKFEMLYRKENGNIEDIIKDFVRPFDLQKAPLFRVELVENKEKINLLIDIHHIISDGVSMSILIKEFSELYRGRTLKPLKLQYKDFAVWQNNFLKSEKMVKQEEYWLNRFSDEMPVLNMPSDYERPAVQSFEGDTVSFEANEDTTVKLKCLAKETGTTMHMVLLSAFTILLSKYSGQEDVVIGTPIAGRPHEELENIMGMFVNTLPLRNKAEGNKKYIDFLKEVKENSLEAYENQSYQLEMLVEKLNLRRDASRNPIFDVMFNLVDTVTDEDIRLDDITLKQCSNRSKISKFDLTLNALESDTKFKLTIEYCSKLFKKETIERLSGYYIRILKSIADNGEIKLYEIDLLSEQERKQILYEFNDTKVDYEKDKTIAELFEAQAEKTPDNIAVVFEDKKLTYRELNEKANSVARVLRDKDVKADSIVGIMVERSLEMIVGIMGILKAGGAYLPIDPYCPKERIEYMLRDSESKILLSKNTLVRNIEFHGEVIDLFKEELFTNESSNLEKVNHSASLAYVIYTSGTTGNPKGVMIEQKSVHNLVAALKREIYSLYDTKLRVALVAPYYFDASVQQIFAVLLGGHSLYITSEDVRRNGQELLKYYEKNKIDISDGTPIHLSMINDSINVNHSLNLKHLIIGGDSLGISLVKGINKNFKDIKISNVYGPTECCVDSSTFLIDGKMSDDLITIPIGKPMNNYKLYITDRYNHLLPIGVAGELCISGDGLARGYLNRTELNAEKFVDNPFEDRAKMYKTGDLARWLSDGNIEFLGRMDNQVKIMGYRIELGEIENRLLQHESIKESVVLVKESKEKKKYICAYVVSKNPVEELNLKDYLKQSLPEYMVPAYFVQLDNMPLNSNGKLHRRALPEPNFDLALTKYEAPRNEVEENLVKIWSEVLGIEKVGINDNFFDIGGNSLDIVKVSSRLGEIFNKEVPVVMLFRYPTIKAIAGYLNQDNINENSDDALIDKSDQIQSRKDRLKKMSEKRRR